MPHFVCLAQFISKPGKENELIKALSSLIEPSRAESGCISYDLHQDINQPGKLTMIEFFKSQEAFDFHSRQGYLTQFKNHASELIESRQLTFCTSE